MSGHPWGTYGGIGVAEGGDGGGGGRWGAGGGGGGAVTGSGNWSHNGHRVAPQSSRAGVAHRVSRSVRRIGRFEEAERVR